MRKYGNFVGIAGGIFIIAGLVFYFVTSTLGTIPTILLVAGLVAIVAFAIINLDVLKDLLTSRSVKFSTNAIVSAVIIFGILILINFIAAQHFIRIDTTEAKQFSLSEQTRKIIASLKDDLRFVAFFKSNSQGRAKDLLSEYSNLSPKVKFELIDPERQPAIAKNYGIQSYGTIVVEYGANSEKITSSTEENLTNAIIKVTREKKKKIYFLTGHGERDIEDVERSGMASARKAIEEENYDVESLFLADKTEMPQDCSVLVIAGPKNELLPNEKDMIDKYLKKGGKALFLLDPKPGVGMKDFVSKWGIEVGDNIVVDVTGIGKLFGFGPEMPLVTSYEDHEITRALSNYMSAYPVVRSVTPKEEKEEGLEVKSLAKTQPQSWAETKFNKQVQFNADEDTPGPISIAVVATKEAEVTRGTDATNSSKKAKTRLVVFGDSDFASNQLFGFQANGDLFMNSIGWLAEEEDLISIRPRAPEDRRLYLTESESKVILIFSVILLPAAVLGAAVAVYVRRR
ncbi:MAG: Gldg family protein [bacterium]